MNKLTLEVDCWLNPELRLYLEQLDGVNKVNIDIDNGIIEIEYLTNIISLKILMKEIELFLDITKVPYLLSFDKHSENTLNLRKVNVDDFCCEYCVKGNVFDLLVMDGIEKVTTDFDYYKNSDLNINIMYDSSIISDDVVNKWKFE